MASAGGSWGDFAEAYVIVGAPILGARGRTDRIVAAVLEPTLQIALAADNVHIEGSSFHLTDQDASFRGVRYARDVSRLIQPRYLVRKRLHLRLILTPPIPVVMTRPPRSPLIDSHPDPLLELRGRQGPQRNRQHVRKVGVQVPETPVLCVRQRPLRLTEDFLERWTCH